MLFFIRRIPFMRLERGIVDVLRTKTDCCALIIHVESLVNSTVYKTLLLHKHTTNSAMIPLVKCVFHWPLVMLHASSTISVLSQTKQNTKKNIFYLNVCLSFIPFALLFFMCEQRVLFLFLHVYYGFLWSQRPFMPCSGSFIRFVVSYLRWYAWLRWWGRFVLFYFRNINW